MLLLHILYWLPIPLLAIICIALVGKVRAGRYKKEWLGYGTEAPAPASAVAVVMAPILGVIVWATAENHVGLIGLGCLALGASVLAYFVYGAASKRRSESNHG
ncbi:hypothetical protein G7076_04915 [Sphingomonas sp. HDW15A]|uniref:hypothetical protein n=1 Tax=Sphingomonas sp. HDW15A TaxID=2714942 RepID=UPI001408617E|nr:hypothetical protein [Sphingomonas sp. HDW15A]QIK95896.1 hypothetical protein G7076_04915 [Sphingomonas sp. HDW15A]